MAAAPDRIRRTIFAACREMGLDDEVRRDLTLAATGQGSMAGLGAADLEKVLEALRQRGWKPGAKGRHAPAPRADLRLVHALWGKLGRAGRLDRPGRAGLNAFVRKRFGAAWGAVPADIDMLRDHAKIDALVQALKQWCRREGLEDRR